MEFWNLYRIIRKRLWMVLFLVLVTVASTISTVTSRPLSYKASATIRVAVTSPSVADVGRLDWFTAGIMFSTIQETILSRTILQEVIDQNFLGVTTDELRRAVGVIRIGNSNLLRIDVKTTDPESAKRLANDLAATFIRYNQKLLDTQSSSSIAFYEEQVKLAEQNYERAKEDFRNALNQPNARAAENQFIAAQGAYQGALDKLEAARLVNRFPDLRPASVGIAEPAVTPTEPEGQQIGRYSLIALLVSLILGIFLAIGIEYLDLSVKSPYEVTGQLGPAVIGVIPHFRRGVSSVATVLANLDLPLLSRFMRWRIHRLESSILPPESLPLQSAEAFRKARLNLVASHRRHILAGHPGASAVLVTSTRARDGKTTITANLGVALSRAGFRVLLIDGNLREPQLHCHFGLETGGPGLAGLLRGEATQDAAISQTAHANLFVLTSGVGDESPGELLDSQRLSELVAMFARRYDFILCDSPALGLFTDAAVLAERFGRALLVTDAARLSVENEMRTLGLLEGTGVAIEGIVINKINPDYVDPNKLHDLPRHVVGMRYGRNGFANGSSNGQSHDPAKSHSSETVTG